MKPLKPSMREKKRYILIKGKNLKKNVPRSILDFIGVLGMSKVNLRWIESKPSQAIISINRGSLNHVKASFAVWPETIKVERVSGTLKGVRKKGK